MEKPVQPAYSARVVERMINWIIRTVFYYRLLFVFIAFLVLTVATVKVWNSSDKADKYKNIATIFALGSVTIGIFYSILNYEHSQIKYRNDIKSSRSNTSFTAACEWHRPTMVEHLKVTKKLYYANKHLIGDNLAVGFSELLEKDEEARSALVSIFNYLECIALGIEYGVLDHDFMRSYFRSVFTLYHNNYGFYIAYRRAVNNTPTVWLNFTNLAQRWNIEGCG